MPIWPESSVAGKGFNPMVGNAVELVLGGTLKVLMREIEPSIATTITLTLEMFTVTAKGDSIMFTLPIDKQARVRVAYVDAAGNPATVDNEPVWSSSDDAIARVTADPDDGFEATVTAMGPIGQVQIVAKVDADIGEGERELVTLMDVTTIGGEAVAGTIEPVGSLEDIPRVDNTLPPPPAQPKR